MPTASQRPRAPTAATSCSPASKSFVVDGHTADLLLVAARDAGHAGRRTASACSSFPADTPGVERRALGTMDQTRRLAEVRLDDVRVAGEAGLGDRGAALARLSRDARSRDGRARRRAGRRRRALPRARRRLREGARAVRPADRLVPGDQAQVRRHADAGRVGALGALLRRLRRRRARAPISRRARRSRRPTARRPTSSAPPTTCRSTAASASPGSTTCTSTSSAPSRARAARHATDHRELVARTLGL